METTELIDIPIQAEDSRHQFKADIANVDFLRIERMALSNTLGERIFIGTTGYIEITNGIAI